MLFRSTIGAASSTRNAIIFPFFAIDAMSYTGCSFDLLDDSTQFPLPLKRLSNATGVSDSSLINTRFWIFSIGVTPTVTPLPLHGMLVIQSQ
jgi:hypothetical protein